MPANPDIVDTTKPEAIVPDTATTPVTEPMINVEVQDRLLRELKRRLFPSDVEGILYSAIVGDLYWQDQLWSLMVDTWPRLQTNLGKLKQAVSSMEYVVHPFTEGDEEPTASAQEKADFVEDALFGMHGDVARQEHDFEQTTEDIIDSLIAGFTVMEVYWEHRDGGIMPQCTRWLPARYYRFPYVLDDIDRLMLNPSGMLGGTQLVDFPPYKFLVCIKQSHANHPVFTSPMRCLTAWWIASRFGLEWMMSYAQLFGIPQRVAYYQPGDDVVYQKLVQMMRASATATWGVYPINTKVEVLGTAGGGGAHMPQERLVDEADKVCDIMILGQTLTTEVRESGGNRALGMVHHKVMDEILEAASRYVSKVISTQLIPGIVQYNFGSTDELPTLAPVIKDPVDLFNLAQAYNILFNQMQVPVLNSELYERIEFTKPDKGDDVYVPPAIPAPAAPFGAPQPQPEGTKPQPEHTPNGNQPAALKPNIVERVGARHEGGDDRLEAANGEGLLDPDDDDDPDDGSVVEARHEHRHPKTGRFIPALVGLEPETEPSTSETKAPKPETKPPKRKVGVKRTEPMPEVGLMCKENIDMGDAKVCQACQEISEEGWIPVDEEFLGYSMNAPHHPNCRCKTDYKTVYRGVDILHSTKSGNPHHHPETGRFVSKPGRKVRAAFDPSEARDEEGKWTSEGGGAAAELKKKVEKPDFSWIQDPKQRKSEEEAWKEGERINRALAKSKQIREKVGKIDAKFAEPDFKKAETSYIKLKQIHGESLQIDEGAEAKSNINTARKVLGLAMVPDALHERLAGFGLPDIEPTTFKIGDHSSDHYVDIAEGEKPRGWSEGSTFKDVTGLYSPRTKTVVLGGRMDGARSDDNEELALHEMGHAVAHTYGQEHEGSGAWQAWDKWNAGLHEDDKKSIFRYFTQQETKKANVSEALAESFKDYHKYGPAVATHRWGKAFADIHKQAVDDAEMESRQLKRK